MQTCTCPKAAKHMATHLPLYTSPFDVHLSASTCHAALRPWCQLLCQLDAAHVAQPFVSKSIDDVFCDGADALEAVGFGTLGAWLLVLKRHGRACRGNKEDEKEETAQGG